MAEKMGLGGWMEIAGSLTQLFGYVSSGRVARIDGERNRVAAEFAAIQATRDAGEALSVSQRAALEEQRKGRYEASRALAVAAASGGGASDPTIVNLLANVKGEAAYRSSVALYEGESRARKLRLQAVASRLSGEAMYGEGKMLEAQYDLAGSGALIKGAGSLYAKYGMGGGGGSGDAALIAPQNSSNKM